MHVLTLTNSPPSSAVDVRGLASSGLESFMYRMLATKQVFWIEKATQDAHLESCLPSDIPIDDCRLQNTGKALFSWEGSTLMYPGMSITSQYQK